MGCFQVPQTHKICGSQFSTSTSNTLSSPSIPLPGPAERKARTLGLAYPCYVFVLIFFHFHHLFCSLFSDSFTSYPGRSSKGMGYRDLILFYVIPPAPLWCSPSYRRPDRALFSRYLWCPSLLFPAAGIAPSGRPQTHAPGD